MKKIAKYSLYVLMALTILAFIGCGKKGGSVDTNKPLDEIKAEADKMDLSQLKAMAVKYKDAIMKKQGEIEKLMKNMPTNPLSEDAKALMEEVGDLGDAVKALTDRFQIYYDKLKEKGGDVSGLELN